MSREFFLTALLGAVAFAADNPPNTTTETVVAHDEDIIPLHSSVRETTLIVLPASEKAMGVFCGDKTYWNVDVIPGAERYVAVKPSKTGISTDIHIVRLVLLGELNQGTGDSATAIHAEASLSSGMLAADACSSALSSGRLQSIRGPLSVKNESGNLTYHQE